MAKKKQKLYGTTVNVTFSVLEKLDRLAKHYKRTKKGHIEVLIEEDYKKIFG